MDKPLYFKYFSKNMVVSQPAVSKQVLGTAELVELCCLTGDTSGGDRMQGRCVDSSFVQSADSHVQVTATAPTSTIVMWSYPLLHSNHISSVLKWTIVQTTYKYNNIHHLLFQIFSNLFSELQ